MSVFYKEIEQLTIEGENNKKAILFEKIREVIRAAAREGKRSCVIHIDRGESLNLIDSMEELGNFQITHYHVDSVQIDWKYEMISYKDLDDENDKLREENKELKEEIKELKQKNEQRNCDLCATEILM